MTTTDWAILDEDGVQAVAQHVARSVTGRNRMLRLEYEDTLQEAYIALATKKGAREALELGPGILNNWLTQQLTMDGSYVYHERRMQGYVIPKPGESETDECQSPVSLDAVRDRELERIEIGA